MPRWSELVRGAAAALVVAAPVASVAEPVDNERETTVVFVVYRDTPCLPEPGVTVSLGDGRVFATTDSLGMARLRTVVSREARARLTTAGGHHEIVFVPEAGETTYLPIDLASLE